MKKLYCFDFDGTLTYNDTMFLFLKFYNRWKFRIQFLRHIPVFALLFLKLVDAEKTKKSFIASILRGESQERIKKKSMQFCQKYYPEIFRTNALEFIANIDRGNTDLYIVSASLDIWVQPFADHFDMQLLSTKAEYQNGVFTGNFIGNNCNGAEKVVRITEAISGKRYDKIIAFGDTNGDKEMLEWADESHFKFFH